MTKGQKLDVRSFHSFHNAYSTPLCIKPRGGIPCLISENAFKNIITIDMSENDAIKVTVMLFLEIILLQVILCISMLRHLRA